MKKTTNLIKKKSLLLVLIFLFISSLGSGQVLISTNPLDYPDGTTYSSGVMHLPGIHLNEIKDFTIPVLVALPYTINPTQISGSCLQITSNNSVSVSGNIVTVQVTEMCAFDQSSFLNFRLDITKAIDSEQHLFRVPILRDTIKVVLTLDISGSMAQTLDDGITTRLQALKDAVNILVPKLQSFQQEGDSLGLTYFTTTVIQPEFVNFPKKFIRISHSSETINTSFLKVYSDLNPRTQLQMTAMGSGLLDAKSKLLLDKNKAPNTTRMAFLFTDGRQNQYPRVLADGIALEDGSFLNDLQANPKDSIRYFILATWDAGVTIETLIKIGEESGGATTYANPATDLDIWFNDQLTNMLSNGSPQVVINKEGKSISDSLVYSFNLNELITTLAIDLSSYRNDSLKIIIQKDGFDVTQMATKLVGEKFHFFTFNFPLHNDPIIQSGGKWKITIKGNSAKPFHLSAIADDHYLEYNCHINQKIYTVGDSLKLSADLSFLGEPLLNANNSVQAIILKPGDDLGNLLATFKTPQLDSLADMDQNASAKFQELMANDSAFYNAILPKEQIINLIHNGNGNFTGLFTGTELTGIYNIIFLVKGETVEHGKFERSDIVSSVFKFGQVVEEAPQIIDNSNTGNQPGFTVLRIRPKNKFGNYMGPGFKSKIAVTINKRPAKFLKSASAQTIVENENQNGKNEPYLEKIEDNLDGSYLIYLANVNAKDNPDIVINVRDEILYEGKLHPIPLWFYIILVIIIIIILLLQKFKANTKAYAILMKILFLICLIIYVLHRFGILYIL